MKPIEDHIKNIESRLSEIDHGKWYEKHKNPPDPGSTIWIIYEMIKFELEDAGKEAMKNIESKLTDKKEGGP